VRKFAAEQKNLGRKGPSSWVAGKSKRICRKRFRNLRQEDIVNTRA
jgi:hypothetical protein